MLTERDLEKEVKISALILCFAGIFTFLWGLGYFGSKQNQGLLGLNCSSDLEGEILSAWNNTRNASQTDIARDLMEKNCMAVFNCATWLITGAAITANQLLFANDFCNTFRASASTAHTKLQTFSNSTDLGEIITPVDKSDKNCMIAGGCLSGIGAIIALLGFCPSRISKSDSTDSLNEPSTAYGTQPPV